MQQFSDPVMANRYSALYDEAYQWLCGLLDSRCVIDAARAYLLRTGSITHTVDIASYLMFVRLVLFHLNRDKTGAQTLIQNDFNQFVSWGYSPSVLRNLASLQRVMIP